MRALILVSIYVACFPILSSCDFAFAETKQSWWLSKHALMGLYVEEGSEFAAEIYLFDEVSTMPDAEEWEEGDRFGGFPLAVGVVDEEKTKVLFPLMRTNMVQANSVRLTRDNGHPYVEFDFDFSGNEIIGRWREGKKKATLKHKFVRYRPYLTDAQ